MNHLEETESATFLWITFTPRCNSVRKHEDLSDVIVMICYVDELISLDDS